MKVPRLDWVLMVAVLALVTLGTLLVWSATSHRVDLTGGDTTAYLRKQLVNVVIGLVLMVVVLATDHRWVRIVAPLVYLGSIAGLVLVLMMGSTVNGSRSWLQLGGMSLQPSEIAKLAVVIGMALWVAERADARKGRPDRGLGDVVGMLVIAGVPAALILLQPDLGTMLVLSATVLGVVAVSGAPRRWLGLLVAGGVTAAVPRRSRARPARSRTARASCRGPAGAGSALRGRPRWSASRPRRRRHRGCRRPGCVVRRRAPRPTAPSR